MRRPLPLLLLLLALAPAAAGAQEARWEFHGIRMGMSPKEVHALGFPTDRFALHAVGAPGRYFDPARLEGAQVLAGYFVKDRLFELAVIFAPLEKAQALAFTRAFFARYGAPSDLANPLYHSVSWRAGGVTIHYIAEPYGDERFAPNLLFTDEKGKREARIEWSQPRRIPY